MKARVSRAAPGTDEGDHRSLKIKLPSPFAWQRQARAAVFESAARFILIVMGRRAGKTTACADISGRNALGPHKCDNLWGAPTHAIATIGREKLQSMFGTAIRHSTTIDGCDYFWGGGNIRWKSLGIETGAIGRGYGLVVVDEAARIKSQRIYEDVVPTVADTGGKILAITTPRGRRNWTFDWYCRAKGGDPTYQVIHGPSTANPSPFVRDFVQIARSNMPDTLFRQEIMAEFVEGEGAVFRKIREAIKRAEFLAAPPSPDRRYVIGCDVAKHQDFTVLYAMDRETAEVHGGDRFQHVDWPLQEERIKSFSKVWNNGTVILDSTGVGDSTFDHLVDKSVPVIPVTLNASTKNLLIRGLSIGLENGEVGIVDDDALVSELESYAYEVSPTGNFRYSAPEGQHDDCVIALGLALHGRNMRLPSESWTSWLGEKVAAEKEKAEKAGNVGEEQSGWRPGVRS